MTWIHTIPISEATGKLAKLYERIKGPDDNVDNIMLAHSERPHTLEGHMHLYKRVLHSNENTLPRWYLEALGVYVSHLNRCGYCFDHHMAGMSRELGNEDRSAAIRDAVLAGTIDHAFGGRELEGMRYAGRLTLTPSSVGESDIIAMKDAGFDDGQILEINQVVSYFAYANRTVLGLGIDTEGDVIGLSPGDSEDPDNWSHG